MWFDIFGSINTVFIFVSLVGVYFQLAKVWQRKRQKKPQTTELLSQNQFTVSFFAYFSFFVFGYSLEEFNHYIVWPRLIASLLVALILFEIWQDRKTKSSTLAIIAVVSSFCLGFAGLAYMDTFIGESRQISTLLLVTITVLLAQGYVHQISLVWKSGSTGAIDIRMSQFILMMDISTIAFAITIGVETSWPLILLATVSAVTKLIIMYLFRWVRISPLAESRRELSPL